MSKSMIIIHCSATDDPDHDDIDVIRRWHTRKGWRDVGYHYFIRKDGLVEAGRKEHETAAGALPIENSKGDKISLNREGIHICLHGLKKELFTSEQFDSCAALVREIRTRHEILDMFGHRVVSSKSCPVFNVMDEIYPRLYEARFKR